MADEPALTLSLTLALTLALASDPPLGTLRTLDGREIAPDERERADLLLTSDRPPIAPPPPVPEARLVGNKVPLKLTSLQFDVFGQTAGGAVDGLGITGLSTALGGGTGGGAPSGAPLTGAAGFARIVETSHGGPPAQNAAWHPLSGGHESFFLPAAKQSSRQGAAQQERRGVPRPLQWRALDPRDMPPR